MIDKRMEWKRLGRLAWQNANSQDVSYDSSSFIYGYMQAMEDVQDQLDKANEEREQAIKDLKRADSILDTIDQLCDTLGKIK